MKKYLLFLCLIGCTKTTPIIGANGKLAYKIEANSQARLLEKAKKVCPDGYVTILRQKELFDTLYLQCNSEVK